MPIDVLPPRITTRAAPREILAIDFGPDGELPIRGGWGYSFEDAVIIDRDDPAAAKRTPFNGIAVEYEFVAMRIYEELIVLPPDGETYSGIERKLLQQAVVDHDDRPFDVLLFEVTAVPDSDWAPLAAELEGPDGAGSPWFDAEEHRRKRESKTIRFVAEYYFDIKSFYGSR